MDGEKRQYWGAPEGKYKAYSVDFAEKVEEMFASHMEAMEERQLSERIMRSWCQHHSRSREGNYDNSELIERGEAGANIEVSLAEFRSLVRQILSIVLGRKLTYTGTAQNSDSVSLSATTRAKKIIRHYEARGGFTEAQERLAEESIVMAASWIGVFWDPTAKPMDKVNLATKELEFEGDLEFPVFHSMQVAYDRCSDNIENPDWMIIERRVNRFNLAAAHVEYEDTILEADSKSRMSSLSTDTTMLFEEDDDDYIRVLYVYVKRTPHNPVGRLAIVLDSETVIWDGPLETSRIPVFMLASSKDIGESGFPYGDYQDLLPIAELMQDAHSELASMFAAMAACLWIQKGDEAEFEELGPFNVLRSATKPETVQLFRIQQEHYQYLNHLLAVGHRFAMISEAMTGNVNAADSGSKLAFMQSTSMEQHGGFVRRLVRVMESAMTMAIEVLRKSMSGERVVHVVGQGGMAETVRFTSDELNLVQSVLVEQVDPQTTTPEFRRAMADTAAQKDWVGSPAEWVTAFKTGLDDVYTEDELAKEVHVRRENESLRTGREPVEVLETDDHMFHIRRHAQETCDDAIRNDPAALQRHREHWNAHLQNLTPGSEAFLAPLLLALGQKPLPNTLGPDQAQAPPEMQPPGAVDDQKPQGSPPAEVGLSGKAKPSQPGPAGMPGPPKNPGSGNEAPTPALQGAPVPPGATK